MGEDYLKGRDGWGSSLIWSDSHLRTHSFQTPTPHQTKQPSIPLDFYYSYPSRRFLLSAFYFLLSHHNFSIIQRVTSPQHTHTHSQRKMAFINSFTPPVQLSPSSFTPSVSPAQPVSKYHAAPTMKVDIAEKVRKSRSSYTYLEEGRLAKEESKFVPKRGFTENAELLNGRLAQLGFVIGLVTELATGKGINEQLSILVSPITHLIGGGM